jgi:hypothetical protein
MAKKDDLPYDVAPFVLTKPLQLSDTAALLAAEVVVDAAFNLARPAELLVTSSTGAIRSFDAAMAFPTRQMPSAVGIDPVAGGSSSFPVPDRSLPGD